MQISKKIRDLLPQIKLDKEFFFCHPEEEFHEFETSEYIVKRLKEIGYKDIKTNIAKTGVLAELKGKKKGECILFRSEMDAVIIDENHKTKHVCGHHAHMAMLLGLAQVLMDNKDKIKGHVKLLFQPAEEGNGGAKPMIAEGVLKNPDVDRVFGLHMWSEIEDGKVGIKKGPVMASTDPFDIKVFGKGGHAALPHKCVDPIYIASEIVTGIQGIVGRNVDPNDTAVIGITAISGGSSNNVIPNEVKLKGICRTFNNKLRKELLKKIEKLSASIAESMGGKIEFKRVLEYPVVVNSKKETEDVRKIAEKIVGEENIVDNYKTMCADDFSFYLLEKPGCYFFIGNYGENKYPQHNENYIVNENSMLIGTELMYNIAKKYLDF